MSESLWWIGWHAGWARADAVACRVAAEWAAANALTAAEHANQARVKTLTEWQRAIEKRDWV